MSDSMADFALEEVMDEEEDWLEYVTGSMSEQEAFDRGIIDELGYDNRPQTICRSKRIDDE